MKFEQMNRFQQLEAISTEAIKQLLPNTDVHFTDEFENYDCWVDVTTTSGEEIRVWMETKVRHTAYDTYILEDAKLKALQNKRIAEERKLGMKIRLFYVNFTPDGTYMWDLDRIKVPKSTVYAGKCTAKATNRVEKITYYLPKSDAIKTYDYIIDKEKIINIIKGREQQ